MATTSLSHALHLPLPSKLTQPHLTHILPLQPINPISPLSLNLNHHTKTPINKTRLILRASGKNDSQTEISTNDDGQKSSEELGSEIKKAMKEREKVEDSNGILSGVFDEIGRIEWPEFGKVIATTGVVLGVIAGSSVVLLTVNAVLAELSDRVFAGKGVQDFFG